MGAKGPWEQGGFGWFAQEGAEVEGSPRRKKYKKKMPVRSLRPPAASRGYSGERRRQVKPSRKATGSQSSNGRTSEGIGSGVNRGHADRSYPRALCVFSLHTPLSLWGSRGCSWAPNNSGRARQTSGAGGSGHKGQPMGNLSESRKGCSPISSCLPDGLWVMGGF